jgi:sugar phosphate isomerase/epimerase
MKLRHRSFLFGLAALLSVVGPVFAAGPQLGLQAWTCRHQTFEQAVATAERHGIKYLELTPKLLPADSSREELLRKKACLEAHGVVAYSFGVNHAGLDQKANRKLFEIAKLMGMKLIVVEPTNLAAWDNLEALVKEYDIRLAIHNHGAGTPYGDPATVRKVLAARDPRIGVCLDIGWVTAAGFDAATVFKSYGDRVYDMHLKDKQVTLSADGKRLVHDCIIGEGQANFRGLFAEIARTGWSGVMAIESDQRADEVPPDTIIAEGRRFFQQSVAALGRDQP